MRRMRQAGLVIAVGCVVALAGGISSALTAGPAGSALAEDQPLRGELVDPAEYLKTGASGPELTEDIYAAVDGGQTLAFREADSGTLYLLMAAMPGEDPNELAYDHIGKRVTVTGRTYERGGLRGILLHSIEEIPQEGAEADPTAEQDILD